MEPPNSIFKARQCSLVSKSTDFRPRIWITEQMPPGGKVIYLKYNVQGSSFNPLLIHGNLFFLFFWGGEHLRHVECPRLWNELKPQQ